MFLKCELFYPLTEMFFIRLVGEDVVTVNVVFDFINLCDFGGTLTD